MSAKLCWIILAGLVGLGWTQHDVSESWCFQFTWVGPEFDNTTITNETCKELPSMSDGGACLTPMVVTDNGFPPNLTEIWEKDINHTFSCKLVKGRVCAKWTQYYEGMVEYQTYLCAKINVLNEGSLPFGCIENTTDSKHTELCSCYSAVGHFPCNLAASHSIFYSLLVAAVIVTAYFT